MHHLVAGGPNVQPPWNYAGMATGGLTLVVGAVLMVVQRRRRR